LVYILELDIAEGNILDMTFARVRHDAGDIHRIVQGQIFEDNILHILLLVNIGAQNPDIHAVGIVTRHILDLNVVAIPLDGDAGLFQTLAFRTCITSGEVNSHHRP